MNSIILFKIIFYLFLSLFNAFSDTLNKIEIIGIDVFR